MSQATVEDEIIQEAGEEGNSSRSHIEPNVIINPGGESRVRVYSWPVQVGKQTSPVRWQPI